LGEPADGGVVVAGAEFVEVGGVVVVAADVAEVVPGGGGVGAGGPGFAVGAVGVAAHVGAGLVEQADHGAEGVVCVVALRAGGVHAQCLAGGGAGECAVGGGEVFAEAGEVVDASCRGALSLHQTRLPGSEIEDHRNEDDSHRDRYSDAQNPPSLESRVTRSGECSRQLNDEQVVQKKEKQEGRE